MNEIQKITLDLCHEHIECLVEYSVYEDPEDGFQITGLVTVEQVNWGANLSALLEIPDVYDAISYMIEEIKNKNKPIHPYWMTNE